MSDLNGYRALVTGASSGIGKATAQRLLKNGATVIVTARREPALTELRDDAEDSDRCICVPGDLTDPGFRTELIDTVRERAGGLDILVNAAGILVAGDCESTDLDAWDYSLDINLRAIFDLCRLAIPSLKESKGCTDLCPIVFVAIRNSG